MSRRPIALALLLPACAALATERREEPEARVPVILPPPPGDVEPAPAARPAPGARGALPVGSGHVWTGQYLCAGGPTDLTVRVERVAGPDVEAVLQTGSARYSLAGRYDPPSGALELVPTRWLEQIPGVPLVGLYGTISAGGAIYEGRVTDGTCRWFALRSAR